MIHCASIYPRAVQMLEDGCAMSTGAAPDVVGDASDGTWPSSRAFRSCVSSVGVWGRDAVAKSMSPTLAGIVWGVEGAGTEHLGGYMRHPRWAFVACATSSPTPSFG